MFKASGVKDGFSLLELLVVIIIIPIMAGVSIAQFNRQTQEVKLDKQADQIIDVMELAKKKSLTGDLGQYAGACPNFSGYRVQFTPASPYSAFNLNICCAGVCNSGIATYTVETPLTVTISGPHPVQFTALSPGTTGAANTVITVRNPTVISKCIDITISPVGIITKGNKIAC